ncbi:hypothetical protein LXL04_034063 [Taraxacum kok-saghyz]
MDRCRGKVWCLYDGGRLGEKAYKGIGEGVQGKWAERACVQTMGSYPSEMETELAKVRRYGGVGGMAPPWSARCVQKGVGYPRDAPATILFGEWFRFGKPSDQKFLFEKTSIEVQRKKQIETAAIAVSLVSQPFNSKNKI